MWFWAPDRGGKVGGVDVQVDELAFVVFHDCYGFEDLGERSFAIAGALVEVYVEGKIWCVVSLSVLAASSALQ